MVILALGIGASTAIYGVLYAVSYRPLPYRNSNELVVLLRSQVITSVFEGKTVSGVRPLTFVSGPDFLQWQKQSDVFSALAGVQPYEGSATSLGQIERLQGYEVTTDFFRVLGVNAVVGRGRHITTAFPAEPLEVIGVTQNAGLLGAGLAKNMILQIYLPELDPQAIVKVRTTSDAKGTMVAIREIAAEAGPGVRVSAPVTMEQVMTAAGKPLDYTELVLGFFAAMALLLATVGVFAVTAYAVTQRTHEIGVRMALGAQRRQVLFAVMGQGTRLSLYGVGIGLLLALGLGEVLAYVLSGVGVGTLCTYFGVALVLLVVAVAASYLAARRAMKINPLEALRCE